VKKLSRLIEKTNEILEERKELFNFTDDECKKVEELIRTMGEIRQKKLDHRATTDKRLEETVKIFNEKKVISPNSTSKLREGFEKGKAEAKEKKKKLDKN